MTTNTMGFPEKKNFSSRKIVGAFSKSQSEEEIDPETLRRPTIEGDEMPLAEAKTK